MRQLCIGFPTAGQNPTWRLVSFYDQLRDHFTRNGWRLRRELSSTSAAGGAAEARNSIVENFLKTDIDRLLLIDVDALPDVGGVLRLMDAADRDDVDAVAGWSVICKAGKDGPVLVPNITGRPDEKGNWPVRVDLIGAETGLHEITGGAVGSHCILVKRRVFDAMRKARAMYFEDDFQRQVDKPQVFGTRLTGHDFVFCRSLHRMRFRLWVDTSVFWGHLKETDLRDWFIMTSDMLGRLQSQRQLVDVLRNFIASTRPTATTDELIRMATEAGHLPDGRDRLSDSILAGDSVLLLSCDA